MSNSESMITVTREDLVANYSSENVSDEEINMALKLLQRELEEGESLEDFIEFTTRAELISDGYPLNFVEAVKPLLTVEYLKEKFPLMNVDDEEIRKNGKRLMDSGIETIKQIVKNPKNNLVRKGCTENFVHAVMMKKRRTDSKRQRTDDGPENVYRTTTGSVFHHVRDDLDSALPSTFDIGAVETFSFNLYPKDFFKESLRFLFDNAHEGPLRALGLVSGVSGCGKTYALVLLAKFITRLRTIDPQDLEDPQNLEDQQVGEICQQIATSYYPESWSISDSVSFVQNLTKNYVPLFVTFNSPMSVSRETEIDYDQEMGKRLAYAYFADMEKNHRMGLGLWLRKQRKGHVTDWCTEKVLKDIEDKAKKVLNGAKPCLIVIFDNHGCNGHVRNAIHALSGNALCTSFGVDCRVIVCSKQLWVMIRERFGTQRPIRDIKLTLPSSMDVQELLKASLKEKSGTENYDDDALEGVAQYIGTMAGYNWHTFASVFRRMVPPGSDAALLVSGALKVDVGYLLFEFRRETVCGLLEEALAHAILGSELRWMEPLYKGKSFQEGSVCRAVEIGVIPAWFGSRGRENFHPVLPLLLLYQLARDASEYGYWSSSTLKSLKYHWDEQPNAARRNEYLRQMLAFDRFSSLNDELPVAFRDFTSRFILLQWDARERIDSAVRRRWSLKPTNERSVERTADLERYAQHIESECRDFFGPHLVERWRNSANAAWVKSRGENAETYSPTQDERPHLWLVPGTNTPQNARFDRDDENDEFVRRLQMFRGSFLCTQNRAGAGIRVCSPDANEAKIAICENELWAEGASINNNDGNLKAGCVIQPASGNPGFDSLILLQKTDSTWALALIENKFEKNDIGPGKVKEKLEILVDKYRGVLWIEKPGDKTPKNAKSLRLPNNILESDVVLVMLHDSGFRYLEQRGTKMIGYDDGAESEEYVKEKKRQMENGKPEEKAKQMAEEKAKQIAAKKAKDVAKWPDIVKGTGKLPKNDFAGHVLLTTSALFFGPSFQKINLLNRRRDRPKTFTS